MLAHILCSGYNYWNGELFYYYALAPFTLIAVD